MPGEGFPECGKHCEQPECPCRGLAGWGGGEYLESPGKLFEVVLSKQEALECVGCVSAGGAAVQGVQEDSCCLGGMVGWGQVLLQG